MKRSLSNSRTRRGPLGFEALYSERFGERWAGLKEALLAPHVQVLRPNGFARFDQRLKAHYAMDRASMWAAELLPIEPGSRVLDACSAPGGKALILAERLLLDAAERTDEAPPLVLNERSRARRARLLRVLEEYVPPELRARIEVTGHDAALIGKHQPDKFDAILLDAPCSSERHVLKDPKALGEWSEARVRHLATQQYALLRSQFLALKPGGVLVYATCALLHEENAAVVTRLLHKVGPAAEEEPIVASWGQKEPVGVSVFPDRDGAGPMYACRLRKRN